MFQWTALEQGNHLFDAIIHWCHKKAVSNIPILISFLSCKLLNLFLLMCDTVLTQSSSFTFKNYIISDCPCSLFLKHNFSSNQKYFLYITLLIKLLFRTLFIHYADGFDVIHVCLHALLIVCVLLASRWPLLLSKIFFPFLCAAAFFTCPLWWSTLSGSLRLSG